MSTVTTGLDVKLTANASQLKSELGATEKALLSSRQALIASKVALEDYKRGLEDTGRSINSMSWLKNAGSSALGVLGGGALLGGIGGMGMLGKQLIDDMSRIDDASQALGVTTTKFQQLKYAASQSGIEFENVTKSIVKMQNILGDTTPTDAQAAAFQKLGLSIADLKFEDTETAYDQLMQALGQMPAGAERTKTATDIFGKEGAKMLPMAGEYDALMQKSLEAGVIITEETIKAANQFGDLMDALKMKLEAFTVNTAKDSISAWQSIENYIDKGLNIFYRDLKFMRPEMLPGTTDQNIPSSFMSSETQINEKIESMKKSIMQSSFSQYESNGDLNKNKFNKDISKFSNNGMSIAKILNEDEIQKNINALKEINSLEERLGFKLPELIELQKHRDEILNKEKEAILAEISRRGEKTTAKKNASEAETEKEHQKLQKLDEANQIEVMNTQEKEVQLLITEQEKKALEAYNVALKDEEERLRRVSQLKKEIVEDNKKLGEAQNNLIKELAKIEEKEKAIKAEDNLDKNQKQLVALEKQKDILNEMLGVVADLNKKLFVFNEKRQKINIMDENDPDRHKRRRGLEQDAEIARKVEAQRHGIKQHFSPAEKKRIKELAEEEQNAQNVIDKKKKQIEAAQDADKKRKRADDKKHDADAIQENKKKVEDAFKERNKDKAELDKELKKKNEYEQALDKFKKFKPDFAQDLRKLSNIDEKIETSNTYLKKLAENLKVVDQ